MATTPNFNWPTPDDTDLVRDGAAAIRNLGDAIDSTVDAIDPNAFTLLASGTLSGASLALTSVPGSDYKEIHLRVKNITTNILTTYSVTLNGVTTGYKRNQVISTSTAVSALNNSGNLVTAEVDSTAGTSTVPASNFYLRLWPSDVESEQGTIFAEGRHFQRSTNSMLSIFSSIHGGPVTSITVTNGGTFSTGTYELFGVK